ncbi:MAG: hypothetical protein R3F20_01400 [Planctomycetota bacterium]
MDRRRELRRFGLLVGGVFILIGAALIWRRGTGTGAFVCLGVGGGLFLGGATVPMALDHVERVWMGVAGFMGKIMTTVLLTVFYFTILIPFSLIRLKDPLGLRRPADATTWWRPHRNPETTLERFQHPF